MFQHTLCLLSTGLDFSTSSVSNTMGRLLKRVFGLRKVLWGSSDFGNECMLGSLRVCLFDRVWHARCVVWKWRLPSQADKVTVTDGRRVDFVSIVFRGQMLK